MNEQPAATPTRHSGRGLLIGLLLGLVVGAGSGAGMTFVLTTNGSDQTGADADARAACEVLSRTAPRKTDDKGAEGLANLSRWGASQTLAMAAAEVDSTYQPLAKALQRSRLLFDQTFDANDPKVTAAVKNARQICSDLGS